MITLEKLPVIKIQFPCQTKKAPTLTFTMFYKLIKRYCIDPGTIHWILVYNFNNL